MNIKDLPSAHQRHLFRSLKNGDLDVATVLEAIGASYAFHWCAEHGEPGAVCNDRCKITKLFRVAKAGV